MIETIFKALSSGLSLWQHKEARKYLDRVLELKKEWYAEFNKKRPDDSTLDDITLELQFIASTFASQVTVSDPKDK